MCRSKEDPTEKIRVNLGEMPLFFFERSA